MPLSVRNYSDLSKTHEADHTIFPLLALHWCFIIHGLCHTLHLHTCIPWSASAYHSTFTSCQSPSPTHPPYSLWSSHINQPPFQEQASSYRASFLSFCFQGGFFFFGKFLLNLHHIAQKSPSLWTSLTLPGVSFSMLTYQFVFICVQSYANDCFHIWLLL